MDWKRIILEKVKAHGDIFDGWVIRPSYRRKDSEWPDDNFIIAQIYILDNLDKKGNGRKDHLFFGLRYDGESRPWIYWALVESYYIYPTGKIRSCWIATDKLLRKFITSEMLEETRKMLEKNAVKYA